MKLIKQQFLDENRSYNHGTIIQTGKKGEKSPF